MTNQLPPILPYETPTPSTPNFGMRAAKASWLAALAGLLWSAFEFVTPLALFGGVVLWIMGFVSSVLALATMRRYGRKGILRPAIIGLCLNLAMLLLLGFVVLTILNGVA